MGNVGDVLGVAAFVILLVVLWRIITEQKEVRMTLDDLLAKVSEDTEVDRAAITLLDGLSQQLKDAIAANDPAKIQAVADAIDAQKAEMSAAIARNTVADPNAGGGDTPVP